MPPCSFTIFTTVVVTDSTVRWHIVTCFKKEIFHISLSETEVLPSAAPQPHSQGSLGGRVGASYFSWETWEGGCTVIYLFFSINFGLGLKMRLSFSFARWLVLSSYKGMARTLHDAGVTYFCINFAPYSRIWVKLVCQSLAKHPLQRECLKWFLSVTPVLANQVLFTGFVTTHGNRHSQQP